jgi:hypothetical protein
LFVAACGSSGTAATKRPAATSTDPRGAANSPYWIAGWVPKGARLDSTRGSSADGGELLGYSTTRALEDDIQIEATPYTGPAPASACDNHGIGARRSTIRGHASCEGPDSDDGHQFGWIVSWIERPGLDLTVVNHDPEEVAQARPIARRIAADLRPVTVATWHKLVEMTTFAFGPEAPPDMTRVVVEHGDAGGARWTLTALLPPDYRLGPDDQRWPCATLQLAGQSQTVCADDAGRGSRFARLDGRVFAFGMVPASAHLLELRAADRDTGNPTANVVRTGVHTTSVPPVTERFYAAELPTGNCGVDVFDATGQPGNAIGQALSLPGDGPPCNPPITGPPTTAPQP